MLVDRLPSVRIYGASVPVAAAVHTLGGLSAHAGQDDLLRWYSGFSAKPPVYLVHGEVESATEFRRELQQRGVEATLAHAGMRLDLATLPAMANNE